MFEVNLILLVLITSVLIGVREGISVSGMVNAGEKKLCFGNEGDTLLSLPQLKPSEALEDADRFSSPFVLVDGGPQNCCCPAEGVGEISSS